MSVRRTSLAVGFAGALTACIVLSACSGATPASSGSAEGAVIGVFWPHVDNTFYRAETTLMVDELKKQGMKPLAVQDANFDESKQISQVQTAISQGARGLILVPVDSKALGAVFAATNAKKIPVVSPDIGIDNSNVFINVQSDGAAMGEQQCQALGKAVQAPATVYYEAGNLSDLSGQARWQGFESCMKKNYPQLNLIMREGKWNPVTGTQQLEPLITTDQSIKAIALASDSVYTSGTLQVLKNHEMLKPVGTPGHIYVSGIDGGPEIISGIQAGTADASVVQPLIQYTRMSATFLKNAIEGKQVGIGPDGQGGTISRKNGVLSDILPAFVATKQNATSQDIWSNKVGG